MQHERFYSFEIWLGSHYDCKSMAKKTVQGSAVVKTPTLTSVKVIANSLCLPLSADISTDLAALDTDKVLSDPAFYDSNRSRNSEHVL